MMHLTFSSSAPMLTITGTSLIALCWYICARAASASQQRIDRLRQVAIFLDRHADLLDEFLTAPEAPQELKDLLVAFSDAMAHKEIVLAVAESMARRTSLSTPFSPETMALLSALDDLRRQRSDLVDIFYHAVGTGVAAALLRWPESDRAIELAATRAIADPRRSIATATESARLGAGIRFGMPAHAPA